MSAAIWGGFSSGPKWPSSGCSLRRPSGNASAMAGAKRAGPPHPSSRAPTATVTGTVTAAASSVVMVPLASNMRASCSPRQRRRAEPSSNSSKPCST